MGYYPGLSEQAQSAIQILVRWFQNEFSHTHKGKKWSAMTTSERMVTASRIWKRKGTNSPLELPIKNVAHLVSCQSPVILVSDF